MPCPACGSDERIPIAPGYWRCTSKREVTVRNPDASGFGAPHAVRSSIPPVLKIVEPCGTEYAEETAGMGTPPLCWCRTFAIGTCASCDAVVCGIHSTMGVRGRLCQSCDAAERSGIRAQESAAEAERQRTEAAHQASAEQRAWRRVERFTHMLADAGSPGLEQVYRHDASRWRRGRPIASGWAIEQSINCSREIDADREGHRQHDHATASLLWSWTAEQAGSDGQGRFLPARRNPAAGVYVLAEDATSSASFDGPRWEWAPNRGAVDLDAMGTVLRTILRANGVRLDGLR